MTLPLLKLTLHLLKLTLLYRRRRYQIDNIVLTLDEADALLSTLVTREEVDGAGPLVLNSIREELLFRLVGRSPLGAGSFVRSVLWVGCL